MSGSCDGWTRSALRPQRVGSGGRGFQGRQPAHGLELAVRNRGAAEAVARITAVRLPKMPEQPGRHRLCLAVDVDHHVFQERMARRLHVDLQHLLGIAAGDEHVRADDLGGIAGRHADQLGRRQIEPAGRGRDRDDNQRQQPFRDLQKALRISLSARLSALDLPSFLTQIFQPVERDQPNINHDGRMTAHRQQWR